MSSTEELKTGIVYNKLLWTVTSGTVLSTSPEAAQKLLQRARKQILEGVKRYKPASEASVKKLKETLDAKTSAFVLNIANQLDLDALQAWDLMVYYLEHEFRGSEDNYQSFLENDTRKVQLVRDICGFYWSERLFLLKCIGIYLACWRDEQHPYRDAFRDLLTELKPEAMLKSLLDQWDYLSDRLPPTASPNTDAWVVSNLTEQLGVIHNLILFSDGFPVPWEDILRAVRLSKRVSTYRHRMKRQHLPLVRSVICSRVILLLRLMDVGNAKTAESLWSGDRSTLNALDTEMHELYQGEENGPLLLAWMLLQFLGPDGEETFAKYRRFGLMATKLSVFSFLDKLLQEPMFKDEATKLSEVAYETVYCLVEALSASFDSDHLQPREALLALVATILRQPDRATAFWAADRDSGMQLLVQAAAHFFPAEFEPLVDIGTSLAVAAPEAFEEISARFSTMDTLAEEQSAALARKVERNPDGSVHLLAAHRPLKQAPALLLRPGTVGVLQEGSVTGPVVRWSQKFSFWLAIHDAEATLISKIVESAGLGVDPKTVSRAQSAVNFVSACLQAGVELEPAMVLPIEMVFTIVERILLVSNPKSTILAACMDVATSLVNGFPVDVTNKLRALDFLPTTQPDEGAVMTHISYTKGHFYRAGVLGRLVVNEERPAGSFPLLRSYLKFLLSLISTGCKNKESQNMAVSGLVYVIHEVFPRCYDWSYESVAERTQVADLCLQFFHRLLNPAALNNHKSDSESATFSTLMAHICLYTLLNTDNGHTLLRICATGESELKARMLLQTSWISGEGVSQLSLVHLALSILNRVLLHKDCVKTCKELSPTEKMIYASPNAKNSLQVVPSIAYYVYHCFNPRLPILAVKLLKRIALEVPMTLRACLAMDGDVIREAFVSKLDSVYYSVELKVAILELITACVYTQPGATEAFFNIHHPQEGQRLFSKDKAPNEEPSGCFTYVCNLLDRAKEEPSLVRSLLYSAVVELLHALWMHHQKILLSFLRAKENFWQDLCAPLYLPPSRSIRSYAQVLNILSSEMYTFGTSIHPPLKDQLQKFFSGNNGYLETWSKFITESLQEPIEDDEQQLPDALRERLALITAWKDLLLVALGEMGSAAEVKLTEQQRCALASDVLKALETETARGQTPRHSVLTMLVELLMTLQARWQSSCYSDPEAALLQLHSMLFRSSLVYQDLPARTRTALLSVGIHAVRHLQSHVSKDDVAMEMLVKASVTMVSHELQTLTVAEEKSQPAHETSAALSMALLQVLCEAASSSNCSVQSGHWHSLLAQSKVVSRVITGLSQSLEARMHVDCVLSGLHLLLALSESPLGDSHLNLPLLEQQLWLQISPSPLKDEGQDKTPATGPYQPRDSWVDSKWSGAFCTATNLVSTMLKKRGPRAVEAAVNFSAVQEQALQDCLLLPRVTLKPQALELTESALKLTCQLVCYSSQWRLLSERPFFTLIRGVTMCLDIIAGLLMRPHLLVSLANGSNQALPVETNIQLTPRVSHVADKLLKCVLLCLITLRHLSPSVTELVCDRELDVESWQPLLEPSLSAPSVAQPGQRPIPPILKLGTLLAVVNVLSPSVVAELGGSGTRSISRSPLMCRSVSHSDEAGTSTGATAAVSSSQTASSVIGSVDKTRARLAGSGAGSVSRSLLINRHVSFSDEVGSSTAAGSSISTTQTASSVIGSLDTARARLALQLSLSLLASQALLLLRQPPGWLAACGREAGYLRRELATEMSPFVDLVRRGLGEQPEAVLPARRDVEESQDGVPISMFLPCSDSDYLRLMAYLFQRVFRE